MQCSLCIVLLRSLCALKLALLLLCQRLSLADVVPLLCFAATSVCTYYNCDAGSGRAEVSRTSVRSADVVVAVAAPEQAKANKTADARVPGKARALHSFSFQFISNARTVRTWKRQRQSSA
ncbi:hypothetical protein ACLKA6_007173 [Drosophila palustris]